MITNEDKTHVMEQLKAAILKDIERQNQVLKRFRWIMVTSFAIFLIVSGLVIYVITRPIPADTITLNYVKHLQENLLEQQKLQNIDRQIFEQTRQDMIRMQSQVMQMQKQLVDSLKNK